MIHLDALIFQMSEQEYEALRSDLAKNKADKFLSLLGYIKEGRLSDEQISSTLNVNQSAYYTLKSRLHDKIQDVISSGLTGMKMKLAVSVSNIPDLVYNTPRETAIAILKKLEEDLIENDLPHELRGVYSALKKLHLHSPKYFTYSQKYNKHLAYIASIDKSEELIAQFNKTLSIYYLSKKKEHIDVLHLIKKEVSNISHLYQSHHLRINKIIVDLSFALFIPLPEAVQNDSPVEDMLNEMEKILTKYSDDKSYGHLRLVYYFFSFEYYRSIKQHKKASVYFYKLNEHLPVFLQYNFCCFTTKFLLSALGFKPFLNSEDNSGATFLKFGNFIPDLNDVPNYINYQFSRAVLSVNEKNYTEAIGIINGLLGEVSFREYPFAEAEVKLLLAFLYFRRGLMENAASLLKSLSRKIREHNTSNEYKNALMLLKIVNLKLQTESDQKKISRHIMQFLQVNDGTYKILDCLNLNEDFLLQ